MEQAHVLGLLIERIDYDGRLGIISISIRPIGIKALTKEAAEHEETEARLLVLP